MAQKKMDGIELEILWSNLIGIVSEQAKALQRIAFSPIVREAGDLASALFDAHMAPVMIIRIQIQQRNVEWSASLAYGAGHGRFSRAGSPANADDEWTE